MTWKRATRLATAWGLLSTPEEPINATEACEASVPPGSQRGQDDAAGSTSACPSEMRLWLSLHGQLATRALPVGERPASVKEPPTATFPQDRDNSILQGPNGVQRLHYVRQRKRSQLYKRSGTKA
eukprot:CAMPEP_0178450836 /NCGR_PEP_ID=MMETSP0689_2-20121128/43343_1 /TAXON_ID=160604 /ORGANISM="Amphidinium massartii, Strain CS-259" /LENGTH=124 /DNA_ID=CAMNT_0020076341 /DNA_START=244 /DNA_END=620 /DNA_ORIENTATION=+